MVLKAFRDGLRRVHGAPAVLASVFVLTFLLALPLGLVVRGMVASSLGSSLAAESAATGANSDWWEEFAAQATGLGTTFTPRIVGFAPVLSNLSAVFDAQPQAMAVTGAAIAYFLLWTFLSGGILDRYARQRPTRTSAFFAASGVFFVRFLRLAVVSLAVYAFLFGPVHTWLFDGVYPWATHNLTAERSAFAIRFGLYLVFGLALVGCNALFDYAKVRAVVEDRRSMIGAVLAAFRFIQRQPTQVFGLYLLDGLVFAVIVAVYGLIAPGAGRADWTMWVGFLAGEAYLLARIVVKLLFQASEVALFQNLLAHADYVAAPAPVWPESPAAEAIAPVE
jgi:hypothetical protein